jgi:hypothetical protein
MIIAGGCSSVTHPCKEIVCNFSLAALTGLDEQYEQTPFGTVAGSFLGEVAKGLHDM